MPGNGHGDPLKDEHLSTSLSPQDGDPVSRGQITSAHEHQEDHASDYASSHTSARDEASNPQTSAPKHTLRRVASELASNEDLDPLSEQAPQVSTSQASDDAPTAGEYPRRSTASPKLSVDTRKVPAESSLVRNIRTLPSSLFIQGVRSHDKVQWGTSIAPYPSKEAEADPRINEGDRAVKVTFEC